MRTKALGMTSTLHMSVKGMMCYLESKYKKTLDPTEIRKQIRYAALISNLRDLQCTRLCETLVTLNKEDEENKIFFACDDRVRINAASWAVKKWIEENVHFGIVPGTFVDRKAIANHFWYPLFTNNGRSSDGYTLTLFMVCINGETQEDFVQVLSQCKSFIPVTLSMVKMDQSTACINAAEKVIPMSGVHT